MEIKNIKAREVLDSRGNPVVEVDLTTRKGLFRAIVPSGASAGKHEAVELRDGGKRYGGKGVLKAVDNVNKIIAKKIVGIDCTEQEEIDKLMIELDKTENKGKENKGKENKGKENKGKENKGKLGANAILAVSMASAKAGAMELGMPVYGYIGHLSGIKPNILPIPMCNVINGGKHAGHENDIQEHMIVPVKAKSFSEAIRMVSETYHQLQKILKKKFGASATLIGDEGGFAPAHLKSIRQRLDIMLEAIKESGYEGKIKFAIDSASSEFFRNGHYTIGTTRMSSGELVDYYKEIVEAYPVISWEDGMAEDDWKGWQEMTKKLKGIQIVGDDLFVTNPERIKRGIKLRAANSVLIKPNQIGTITETLEAIKMAFNSKWTAVISHRSGETEDSFIADLAVGVNAGQIKTGAPARSDRNAKYNQLLRIEEEIKGKYGK